MDISNASLQSRRPMESIAEQFTQLDWMVVFGYLILTTLVGHMMRGKQATIRDFFAGGRSLPWPAVSGSIIATEISGVTFVAVPGMVYAMGGDFTYLQWAIGSVIARIIIGYGFVKVFYEENIYSPYDYMGRRLGIGVKRLATIVFSIGSILGQSVRVLVAALVLRVVTGFPFEMSIIVIGVFAVIWTLMGGMRTVIWTDVMQFVLFAFGGIFAVLWIVSTLPGGWGELWQVGSGNGGISRLWSTPDEVENKFRFLNLTTDPAAGFTLWVAILAIPFLNLTSFGVDQLNAQRMFCCKSPADARKAIIFSSIGQLLTFMMLLVGAAIYVHYQHYPPTPAEQALFTGPSGNDNVFPAWITGHMPTGLRGLIMACIFAAAISSLDSILAALSQTTLSLFRSFEESGDAKHGARMVFESKALVVLWGVFLSGFAIALNYMKGDVNMVDLAFGMAAFTVGPLLAMFLAALWGMRAPIQGLLIGFALSFALVGYVKTEIPTMLINLSDLTGEDAAAYARTIADYGLFWKAKGGAVESTVHYAWFYPVTTLLTLGCGWLYGRFARSN